MEMLRSDTCVIIPTYNNAGTIGDVLARSCASGLPVIVVDDGCTDGTAAVLSGFPLPFTLLTHSRNRGKGRALRTGLTYAKEAGYRYALTIDADGQHFPEDIPLFTAALSTRPDALVLGSRDLEAENMPGGNTFANRFSNFWFRLQTGKRIPDTQTGFRAYPLRRLGRLRLLSARYEAELALLVFLTWKGVPVESVPVRVCYPENRVSSFRPFRDFFRISVLNTVLCVLAVTYGYPRKILRSGLNLFR